MIRPATRLRYLKFHVSRSRRHGTCPKRQFGIGSGGRIRTLNAALLSSLTVLLCYAANRKFLLAWRFSLSELSLRLKKGTKHASHRDLFRGKLPGRTVDRPLVAVGRGRLTSRTSGMKEEGLMTQA